MKRLVWLLLLSMASGQEILRPTADIDPGKLPLGCTGVNVPSNSLSLARDNAGLPTSSTLFGGGSDLQIQYSNRVFTTWAHTANTYTALTLNISASFAAQPLANGCIKYSVDSGNSYTTIQCSTASLAQHTYTVTLDPALTLSALKVAMCAQGNRGNPRAELDPGEMNVKTWDVWTSGTTSAHDAGNGSGAGQAHRGAVVSN